MKKAFRILFLILTVGLMVKTIGCVTDEERIAGYKERCALIGFNKGTDEYASCVLELEKSYEEGKAQRKSSGSGGSMGFLCKDAISRGDSTAINVHCN